MQNEQAVRRPGTSALATHRHVFRLSDAEPYQYRQAFLHRALSYVRSRSVTLASVENYRDQLHQKRIQAYAGSLSPLSRSHDHKVVDTLTRDGICITSLAELGLDFDYKLKSALGSLCDDLQGQFVPEDKFVARATPAQILQVPGLMMWGLQSRMLQLVEHYLQLPAAYHGVRVRRDLCNLVENVSRCWHFDLEDDRVLKVIIYLHDVDESLGPFQYLDLDDTQRVRQRLNYRIGYLNSDLVDSVVPAPRWRSAVGKAGTVVLVDTARLVHRGKRPEAADRYTVFFDYTSRQPKRPYYCNNVLTSEAFIQFASTLSEDQLPYIFWRGVPPQLER
ncbi:2OG-Fe(II) oxygenase [filamentous cyanobacterium LEGE 11480]|uniref:2OG-Fe(II) oxygenase n=1 Tax=Romeriopsis navalis LEGE 11480 TaxID=2777977 RepID=A0A928Z6E3_9CYAN|nr:hypothetical protein [Romeriopsis navalis]MBE9032538.1 2OG-Fe(II) oxygenase [Romeriopsis navalis LEGE 11480]